MQLDLSSILANLPLAFTVYILLNNHLEYMKAQMKARDERIAELEDENQKLQDDHKKDLRLWSGINRGAVGVEDETLHRIREEQRKRMTDEYERRQRLDDSSV
jgi:hypothetical protein